MAGDEREIGERFYARHTVAATVAAALLLVGATVTAVVLVPNGRTSRNEAVVGRSATTSSSVVAQQPPVSSTTPPTTATSRSTTTVVRTTTTLARASSPSTSTVCANSTNPSCGPFRWDGTIVNQGLRLQLHVAAVSMTVGQVVTFTLTASDPDAPAPGGYGELAFGDGPVAIADPGPAMPCDRFGPWSAPPPRAGTWTIVYTHTYQQPGAFVARFTTSSATPDLPGCYDEQLKVGDPWASTATITMPITIGAAPGSASAT